MAAFLNRFCKNCLATKHFLPGGRVLDVQRYFCETCNKLLEQLSGEALTAYREQHPPLVEPSRPVLQPVYPFFSTKTASSLDAPRTTTVAPPPSSSTPPSSPTKAAQSTQTAGTTNQAPSQNQGGSTASQPQPRIQPGRRPSGLIIP